MEGIDQLGNRGPIETGAALEDATGGPSGTFAGLVLRRLWSGRCVAVVREEGVR